MARYLGLNLVHAILFFMSSHKRTFLIVTTFIVVLITGLSFYMYSLLQPVNSAATETTRFVVSKGQGAVTTAEELYEAKLIRHPLVFRLVVRQLNIDDKLQAGSFELSQNMTPTQIAQKLTEGTNDLWVTIPEGWRREEIADSLASQNLTAFDRAEFLALTAGEEGRLFPDTYLLPREVTTEAVVTLLKNTFNRKVVQGLSTEIAQSEREFDQALVMASIIEREARGYQEMRQVAGILWNRYELNMALQADATLQYIKGYDAINKTWWSTPVATDKQLNSPFNTYQYPGLPPRPISNPGLDAIKAALQPAVTNNLFYLHDRTGAIHYGRTLEDHNANIQKYLR